MKRKIRTSALWTIAGFVLGIIVLLWLFFRAQPSSVTSINSTMLKNSIENASDLITTEYNYANVGKFENSHELNGWEVPFTQKNFLLTYQGQVKLGVDASQIDVSIRPGKIILDCPAIIVLSNTIDESSVEVYNESANIFNPISVRDYLNFASQEKAKILQDLDRSDVIEKAKQETERSLKQLLQMVPEIRDSYTVEVRFPDTNPPLSADESESSRTQSDTDENSQTEPDADSESGTAQNSGSDSSADEQPSSDEPANPDPEAE